MSSFLQSREWAEIQERDGRSAHQLTFGAESLFYFTHSLPLGFYYFYAPRPTIKKAKAFLDAIRELQKSTRAVFFRVEPETTLHIPPSTSSIKSAPSLQPRETTVIDLLKSDNELLGLMHHKTRYNIKLAEKHGVGVEKRAGRDAMDDFYNLLQKTADRNGFYLHPKSHYQNLLFSNSRELENVLFFAIYKNEIAAAALVNFYDTTATYLHGASNYALRHVMAPYLLHWRIIEEARKRGMERYDLWGIDEIHWPGVTRFKRGFGGEEKYYPNAVDIVFRPIPYMLYTVARRLRNL